MNLPLAIGLRYSSARKGGFLSFISGISFFGLLLGVIALTVVVSVMNGFDRELKHRILGAVPHVLLETGDVNATTDWLSRQDAVTGYARFIERPGVIVSGSSNRLVSLYGIDPAKEGAVSIVPENMTSGDISTLAAGSNHIVLGRPLAWQLGIGVGDAITVIVPEPSGSGRAIRPRLARVVVSGLFELDSELDYSLVLLNADDLGGIVGVDARQLRIRLDDIFAAPGFARRAAQESPVTEARDWTVQFGDFFETVRMEKTMMFVLLTLIVAIAAFNIVSSLSMMVKDKQADIAVFRTLGLGPGGVMAVFVTQGAIVGLLGTVLGLAVGVPLAFYIPDIVAFFEQLFGARMLAGTYFDRLPSDIRAADLIVIGAVSFMISLLATIYPARQAARLQPASVLRYE